MRALRRKLRQGVVVSNKGDKTIVVAVESRRVHPEFGKVIKQTERFMAHDADNACAVGDVVEIGETRPLSARKRWRLMKIIGKTHLHQRVRPEKSHKAEEPAAAPAVPALKEGEVQLS